MGCASSNETDPNILYGSHQTANKKPPGNFSSLQNGHISPQPSTPNNNKSTTTTTTNKNKVHPVDGKHSQDGPTERDTKNVENGHTKSQASPPEQTTLETCKKDTENKSTIMKGDLSLYNEAKVHRERKLRERLMKRERMAQEMSDRIMEENERLSLTSSRSRATSRATSPRQTRANTVKPLMLSSSLEHDGPSASNQTMSPSTSHDQSHDQSHDTDVQVISASENNNETESNSSMQSASKVPTVNVNEEKRGMPNIE